MADTANLIYLSRADYDAGASDRNNNTIYMISDDQELYLGSDLIANYVQVDDTLSVTSLNPVQNKLITEALQSKADRISQYMYFANTGMVTDIENVSTQGIYIPSRGRTFDFPAKSTSDEYLEVKAQKGTRWRVGTWVNNQVGVNLNLQLTFGGYMEESGIIVAEGTGSNIVDEYDVEYGTTFLTFNLTFNRDFDSSSIPIEENLHFTLSDDFGCTLLPTYNTVYSSIMTNMSFSEVILTDADVDTALSTTSTNPIANKPVALAINSANTAIGSNTSTIGAVAGRVTTLEGKMTTAESEINTLQSDLNTAESDIDNLQADLDTAEGDITALESTVGAQGTTIGEIQGDISTLESTTSTQGSTITSQGARITTLETSTATMRTDINNNDSDISGLDSRLSTAEGTITSQGTRLSTAETDIDNLEKTVNGGSGVTGLTTRMTTAEGEIDTLQSDLGTAESQITAIEEKIPTAATSSNKLVDMATLNQKMTESAARLLTSDYEGNPFPTTDALSQGPYWAGDNEVEPDRHDYAMVVTPEGHQSKYEFVTKNAEGDYAWAFLYNIQVAVDDSFDLTSTNPVQNKVVTTSLNGKQATLVNQTNIKSINNQTLLGSGNLDFPTFVVERRP